MPPRKRASSVHENDDRPDASPLSREAVETPEPDDAHGLAEEAEAEAVAAEAAATAALARARAVKLRRRAEAVATEAASAAATAPATVQPVSAPAPAPDPENRDVDQSDADASDADVRHLDQSADADLVEPDEADPTEPGETDVEEFAEAERPTRRRLRAPRIRLSWVAAALVVLCALGFLGAGGYAMWQHRQTTTTQQRSAEFTAAARQGVVTLMSLNFNHAQDDVKRIIDNTTGDFRKDFQGQADEFAKVAQESKVITEATVNGVGVQSMSKDTATVLVAVTTQVSNNASKEQQPRSWRLRVDMARDGGQLKLAKVEFVP